MNRIKFHIYEEIPIPYKNYRLNVTPKFSLILAKLDNTLVIPQGGTISPLLMNWTLDGLQHFIKISAHEIAKSENLYSLDRATMLKDKDITESKPVKSDGYYRNRTRIEWYNTTWFVRYAEDFLVGVKSAVKNGTSIKKCYRRKKKEKKIFQRLRF